MGDGIVVIFNDPIPCESHVQKAAEMTLEMRDRIKELRSMWLKRGYDLDLGVGFAAGYATLGTMGFEGRMDYGTVGNLPNLAARLCAEANASQVLISRRVFGKVEERIEAEHVGDMMLKGFSKAVPAYNVLKLR